MDYPHRFRRNSFSKVCGRSMPFQKVESASLIWFAFTGRLSSMKKHPGFLQDALSDQLIALSSSARIHEKSDMTYTVEVIAKSKWSQYLSMFQSVHFPADISAAVCRDRIYSRKNQHPRRLLKGISVRADCCAGSNVRVSFIAFT